MSCFHCVWDFNSVLSDKDKILNFTLINDLSSNQAHISLFAFLSSALMAPEPREFCLVWMFCASDSQIHCLFPPTSPGLKTLQTWSREWHCSVGMAGLQQKSQVRGYFLTNPCGLLRCNSWSLWNATKRQLGRKMEANEEPHALGFWGVLGFSMMGVPPLLYHEESVMCSLSFDSCFLMNLLYV